MLLNRRSIHQWFEAQYGAGGGCLEEGAEAVPPGVAHQPAVVLPVIHVDDEAQALRNVEVAWQAGCKGVFLINQREVRAPAGGGKAYAGYPYEEMLPAIRAVRAAYPRLFLGVNFLAVTGERAFPALAALARAGCRVDGYWADNAMVDERTEAQPAADRILKIRNECAKDWNGLYLGGVCFKAQREVPAALWEVAAKRSCAVSILADGAAAAAADGPRQAAAHRDGYVDVVMTSGVATGAAADLAKMAVMRRGVGPFKPLGLASGVTPENVAAYLPYVDLILVATGVSDGFHELDARKLGTLMRNVEAWDRDVLGTPAGVGAAYPDGAGMFWSDPDVFARKRPCPPPVYSLGAPAGPGKVRVPHCLALRKQYLILMSGNSKDDFSRPEEMKHAWLDPSSVCLALRPVVEDLTVPFVVGPCAARTIDFVAGPDAAGFYYAAAMAHAMHCGFLTLRKRGKLPCATTGASYVNYTARANTLEVRTNFDLRGKTAVIVDQWIETGGTMEACVELLEALGVAIAGICVVGLESNHRARVGRLARKYPIFALIPPALGGRLNARDLQAIHSSVRHPTTPKPRL
eukprot:TRINITY_DN1378_c0_g1_i1.p1 TRINITY_DN1378_c0_g1~~TRINITY_DN1378_c0_g1_i1.p1  ORF type:complete len:577 (+),score=194.08 TRINITY_DN1378_c0_g1_i1:88-1818(+)